MKKIKVGFDISQIAHQGGVAVYTQNLAKNLDNLKDLEMVYFYSSLRRPYHGGLKKVKRYHLPPTLFEMLFNKWRNVSIEKFIGVVDIFHSSDWVQPPTKAKKVTTYHDVIPLKYPSWSHPKIVTIQKRRLELVEKEIDMVICVSNSTKNDLLKISKIPEEKMVVIYEGIGEEFKLQLEEEKVKFRKEMGLPEKYILAISGIGERKNLRRIKEAAKGYKLIVSGEDLLDLSFHQLALLYSSASLLLYPSLYEGFGLPILEAMACGTAVITSNVSSMPEIGREAALYVDPQNVEDIKRKVRQIMEDESLRKELIKRGLAQAKKFSWKKAAMETAGVYRKLLK